MKDSLIPPPFFTNAAIRPIRRPAGRNSSRYGLCVALLAAVSFALSHSARGATDTFVSGTSWDITTDWSSGALPASGNDLYFNGTSYLPSSGITTMDASYTVDTLSFNLSGAQTITVNADAAGTTGQTLTLQNTGVDANGDATGTDLSLIGGGAVNIGTTVSTGTITLALATGANGIKVGAGSTMTLGAYSILSGASSSVSFGGGGTLALAGANTFNGITITSGTLSLSTNNNAGGAGTIAVGANTLNINYISPANTITGSGTINVASSANSVVPSGNWNGFTGTINILSEGGSGNKFVINSSNVNLSSTALVNIQNGATFYFVNPVAASIDVIGTGNNENLGALRVESTLSGNVLLLGNASIGSNNPGTISGVISDSGSNYAVTKVAGNTLTLTGANTYGGGTTISAGTLQIGNGGITGSLSTSGTITDNSALIFNLANAATQGVNFSSAGIAGSGSLTQSGGGTLTLTASNSYAGVTTVSAGTLAYKVAANGGQAGGLGQSSNAAAKVLLGNGATLQYLGTSGSTDRLFTLNDSSAGQGATLDASGSGPISYTNPGSIAYGTTGQTRTLTLTGANIGNNTLAALIGNNGSGAVSVTKTGVGTWALTNANTFTGATTVNQGTLSLNFSGAGAPATNIINNSSNSSSLVLGGGTLSLTGSANATNSQQFNGLTVTGGGGIALNANATANPLLLSLNAITRTAGVGGSVNFTLPTGTQSASNGVTTSNSNNANGTLFDFTVGGTDWAAVSSGNVVSYTSNGGVYTTAGTTASAYTNANVDVTSSVSPGGAITPNSLRFNQAAPITLGLLAGTTNVVSSGGILITANEGASNLMINGGTIEGSNNGSLDIIDNGTGTVTIGSVIANNTSATGLDKSGPGTLVLTAQNSYSGTTTVTGGTLVIGNNANSSSITAGQAITLAGGTLDYNLANTTSLGNITLTANSTIGDIGGSQQNYTGTVTGNGFTLTYAGSLSASYGVASASTGYTNGAGQWYNGTYTNLGLLNIVSGFFGGNAGISGPINVASGATLGDYGNTLANNITFNGGSGARGMGAFDQQNGTATLSGAITLAGGTTSFGTTGGSLNITGLITGAGGLAKSNYNTMTLSNANNYTGGTNIDGGTLALTMSTTAASSVLYNGVTANTLTIGGNPSTLINQSNYSNTPTLSVTGAASTNNIQSFANTVASLGLDTITVTPGSSGGVVLNLGALSHTAGGELNFSSSTAISAPSATNEITAVGTSLNNGIIGGWATVSGTGWATVNGSNQVVPYTAYTTTTGAITSGATTNVLSTGASISLSAGTTYINTLLTNATNPTITIGSGNTLNLGAQGGILSTANGTNLTIGTSANNGTLTAGGSTAGTPGEIDLQATGNSSIIVNSTIANNNASTGSANSTGGGAVTVVYNQGNNNSNSTQIYGSNTYSGGTYILDGRVAAGGDSSAFGTGLVTVMDGGEAYLGTTFANNFAISGYGGSENGGRGAIRAQGATVTGTVTLLGDSRIGAQGGTGTFNGQITGAGSLDFGDGGNFILGNTSLTSPNNWTGNTQIDVPVTQAAANQIPSGVGAGNLTLNSTLELGGFNLALNGINGTSTIQNTTTGTPVLSIGNNNQSFVFAGKLTDSGAGSGKTMTLEKDGAGTVELTTSNSYNGGTTVNNGILQMGNTWALGGTTGALAVNGGTLDLNNNSLAAGALTGTGAGAVISSYNQGTASALTLTINPTATGTFAGSIQNGTATSISLVKNGSGTTDFEGANTYSGTTLINAGTLDLGFGGSIANVSGISFALSSSASLALGDAVGANSLTLTGPIGNTASTNSIVGGYAGGNSTLTLNTASGSQSYANAFGGSTATSKNLNLVIAGSGVTVLTGASTYTGATTVNGGSTLNLAGSLGLTAVSLNSGAILVGANGGAIGGTLTASGSSVISLTNGSGSFTVGATTLGSSGAYNSSDYATLLFALGSSVETLTLGSNTLTLNSGGVYVDITNPNTLGTYTLATYADGSAPSGFSLSSTVAGVTTVSLGRNTETLTDTATALTLTIGGTAPPNVAFFDGVVSGKWNDLSNPTFTNFSTNLAGTTDAGNTPASNTDVILNASDVTSGTTETLGASTTINSLTVNGNGTTTIGVDGSTLTIAGNADSNTASDSSYTGNPANRGITIAAGANAFTVNVPVVAATSGSNQTWINGSANLFTVNGNITGSALSGSTQTLTLSDTNSGGTTLGGVIADSATGKLALLVNDTGAGVTTLSGTNTYSGGTTLTGGTLTATGTGGLGAGFVTVNPTNATATAADNATLNTNSSISAIAAVTVNSEAGDGGFGVGTINFNGSSPTIGSLSGNGNAVLNNAGGTTLTIGNSANNLSSTFSGALSGTGAIIKAGTGKLTISGNDSIVGTTTVNAGTLTLSGNNSYTGVTTINSGGTLQLGSSTTLPANTLSSGANLVINTGGTFDLNNFNVTLGAAPSGSGGTITDASATSGTSTLTFSGGGTVAQTLTDNNYTTSNTGKLALNVTGGTLTLSNANTYTGGSTVTSGTLVVSNATGLGSNVAASTVNVSSGALVQLSVTAGNSYNYSFGGSGRIDFNFTGGGSDSYTSNTVFNGFTGIIELSNPGNTGNKLQFQGDTGISGATLQIDSFATAYVSGGTNNFGAITLTGNGNSEGLGAIRIQGGAILGGNISLLGSTTIGDGGGTITGNISSGVAGTQTITIVNGAGSSFVNFTGNISNGSGQVALTLNHGGDTTTLSGSNSYSGPTTLTSGTLVAASTTALSSSSAFVLANTTGVGLNIAGYNNTIGSLTGGGTTGGNVTLGAAALTIGANNTSPAAYAGVISSTGSPATSIVKIGAGTETFSGANTYTGATLINGGILNASSSSALGTGNVTFGGGTLQYGTSSAAGTDLSGRIVSSGSAISLDTDGQNVTYASSLAGSNTGGLTLQDSAGGGSLALTASNNYSGGTTINSGGDLKINSAYSMGNASGSATINSGGTLEALSAIDTSRNFLLSGNATIQTDTGIYEIDGTVNDGGSAGILVKTGAGTLDLTGNNGYSGGTVINAGTVQINTATSLGNSSGSATINSGGTLEALSAIDTSRNFLLSGNATIRTDSGIYEIDGTVNDGSSSGTLIKNGSGTLDLTAANGYSGGTVINAGAVQINSNTSLGNASGNATINGATLEVLAGNVITTARNFILSGTGAVQVDSGASYTVNGSFNDGSSQGSLNKTGAGALTLGASSSVNDYGNVNVNGGTLIVAGSISGNVQQVNVNSGATLGGTGTINSAVQVNQFGTISAGIGETAPAGSFLTINNNLTLSGTATIALNVDGSGNADYLAINNNLNLDPGNTDTLALTILGTITGPETVTIAEYGGTYNGGQFGNIEVFGNGAYQQGSINYINGGDEVTLTLTAVPEPGTWAMLIGGMGMLCVCQRRRGSRHR